MKLVCNVQLTCRLQPAGGGRAQRSSLTIGKQPGTENLFLLYQTTQNKLGTKYKILGNIERLFTTYLKEGKATIRFRVPSHDLCIKCDDIIQLKCFLQTLKHAVENKIPQKSLRLSSLCPTGPVIPKLKTSMTITTKSDYPVLLGFPRTLEILTVNRLEMKIFDSRILCLRNLQTLNLSYNLLTTIPEALGKLPVLTTLNLSHNQLGRAADQDSNWLWCNNNCMKLRMLDLGDNELSELTNNVRNLKELVHLKVDVNLLESLPPVIGCLSKLRYLSASHNCLKVLPGSVKHLHLECIDVAGNKFSGLGDDLKSTLSQHLGVPNLTELAARVIVNKRLRYPNDTVPRRLLNYFNEANYCACGSACFETRLETETWMDLKSIAGTVITGHSINGSLVKVQTFYCSQKCKMKHMKYE